MNNINKTEPTQQGLLEDVDRALSSADEAQLNAEVCRQRAGEGMSRLARYLRIIGAATLIGSALTFMVQQWDDVGHIARYFHFLGFTVLLTVSGFLCGLQIREDKGARTLLALAAAIIPVHFCQLGALLYSIWPYKELGIRYPSYLLWSAPDTSSALTTCLVGIAALLPICLVSFTALARGEAKKLTALYLSANALLLLPFRNPDLIALLALAQTLLITRLETSGFTANPTMKTQESLLIRVMLWVPLATMIGRNLHLYPTSDLFTATMFAIIACLLLFFVPTQCKKPGDIELARCLGLVPLLFAFWYLSMDLKVRLDIDNMYSLPLAFLPFAGSLLLLSRRHVEQGRIYRHTAVATLLLAGLSQMTLFPGVFSSIFCLVTAIFSIAYSLCFESKPLFYAAAFNFGYGILYHLYHAFELYGISPWLSLAILGLAVVIGASLVERYQATLGERLRRFRHEVEERSTTAL